jgi:hypothetical protein
MDPDSASNDPYCFLWVKTARANYKHVPPIQVIKNTRFREAMEPRENCYFFSADLENYPGYEDTIPDWRTRYKSCIVVPLRCIKEGGTPDFIGFLKVETMQVNKLNEKIHVQIVAELADLIYLTLELSRLKIVLLKQQLENSLPKENK